MFKSTNISFKNDQSLCDSHLVVESLKHVDPLHLLRLPAKLILSHCLPMFQ